jgi:hypothetical protein
MVSEDPERGSGEVTATQETFLTRDTGPAVEQEIVRDMIGRAAWAAPALVAVCGLAWGFDGALSSAFAVVLVLVNFLVAAAMLGWAARISLALLMGAAMFGYLLRLGLISAAVLLVKDQPWVQLWALGLTLIVTHLGLLLWELRYVSASLAFPGLKPVTPKESRHP